LSTTEIKTQNIKDSADSILQSKLLDPGLCPSTDSVSWVLFEIQENGQSLETQLSQTKGLVNIFTRKLENSE
jgi:hypothetical protein